MKHLLLSTEKSKITKPNNCNFPFAKVLLGFGILIFALFPFGANAQTTMNATGGSGTITGNIYAYSIGEMVLVNTVETSDLIVTQGLLQSNIDEMGIVKHNILAEGMSVYPNPTDHILFLQPSLQAGGQLSLKLFDLRGRLIMQREANLQFGTEKQRLNLSSLQEGAYLLQASLQQNGKTYEHSFKIFKLGVH